MCRPQDCGLILHRGIRPLYFTDYRIVQEGQDEHIEATLAIGGMITVHSYFSKRLNRMVKAEEAIYRLPKNLREGEEK